MRKKLMMLGFSILLWSVANATVVTPQGLSYVTGTTVSSTPVTIAVASGPSYKIDLSYRVICPGATAGPLLITDQGSTICNNDTPAANSGGWDEMSGWSCDAPSATTNAYVILTDVNGVGLNYTFKIWNATSRTNRPQ
jgi:hypothetical protein